MKLVRSDKDRFVFELSKRERALLFEVLKLYPLIPKTSSALQRGASKQKVAPDQQLLEQALNEQRRENRQLLEAMLREPERFTEKQGRLELTLTTAQMEWLLQVLNDIRVGSWLLLGSPDAKQEHKMALTPDNAIYYGAMELSALFQMRLLKAFDQRL
ncbi:MAG: hypothetical protein AB1813_26465 [Verrucomicrobiota bacterium]|jgi:hypothetical protein